MKGGGRQLRTAGMEGRAYGLDFGALMTMGAARGVDVDLLAQVLPAVETIVIDALHGDDLSNGEGEVIND